LVADGKVESDVVAKAITHHGLDPDAPVPWRG
jgi:hypothetical protein